VNFTFLPLSLPSGVQDLNDSYLVQTFLFAEAMVPKQQKSATLVGRAGPRCSATENLQPWSFQLKIKKKINGQNISALHFPQQTRTK